MQFERCNDVSSPIIVPIPSQIPHRPVCTFHLFGGMSKFLATAPFLGGGAYRLEIISALYLPLEDELEKSLAKERAEGSD